MKKVIMIAGGGTGGHIYPGIAVARALQEIEPSVEVFFVGTRSGLESKILGKENLPLFLIEGGKLNFSGAPLTKLISLLKLPLGFFQSVFLLLKYRPSFVLGVGGYASGPFVLAATLLGFRSAIWEANAYPGMANRWLSRFVHQCFLVFEEAKAYLHCRNYQVVGVPVRHQLGQSAGGSQKRSSETNGEFHLLHYGGSQGSRAIGRTLCEAILTKHEWTKNLKVVHQTGSIDYQDFLTRYQGHESTVEIKEFIYDMPQYYLWADLVLCRGGASTMNELAAFGLPAIVIPLPAADGHQEKNAQVLVQSEAAHMILQRDLTPDRLVAEIQSLRQNPDEREKLKKNIRKFFRPQAAEEIAKALLAR
ncbi:MAG: undecaprenyldiphospho-muramoylpentapeptide beta-N-acetylglucosaminyltransferase [Bdellovibrio sp. CG10_big_fil_rev_8_21_14_0_10_47_8]|nr:MAG: undecaprenyldiphospho-muramoylpentapeptide beta-N-acetylglucosaminyltransferase [Bdellovibrio sp. CG10_big_fil_rev_8_21_14_0_10_47_8]